MPIWMRRTSFAFVALTLLAGLGVLLVGESFVHTDDGCAVETHCITCQRAVVSTGVFDALVALPQVLTVVGYVTPPSRTGVFEAPCRSQASRGPPQA
jgi:hypothetical protein